MERKGYIDKCVGISFIVLLVLAAILSFTSCRPCEETIKYVNKDSIVENVVERKVYVTIPGDEGWMEAYFELDSINNKLNAIILSKKDGERIKTNLSISKKGNGLTALFTCKEDSLKTVITAYDKYVREIHSIYTESQKNVKKDFWNTTFGKVLNAVIWFVIGVVLGIIVFFIIYSYKLIKNGIN